MKKRQKEETIDPFPLSRRRFVDGTRRLAREKVVQMLSAFDSDQPDIESVFQHIFFREFNIGDGQEEQHGRPLKPEEIEEMEADTPIHWREKDIQFARTLLHATLGATAALDERIERLAKNWDLERIALIDRQLLRMAITEMKTFDDIVPRISINEAIELAKIYSTEKSSVFINGILDAARDELIAEGSLASSASDVSPTPDVDEGIGVA